MLDLVLVLGQAGAWELVLELEMALASDLALALGRGQA